MTPTQNVPEDRIQIGQLRSAYGLNGWLWVYSNTEPMSNIFDYLPWYIETKAGWQMVDVKRWKPHGKGLVVSLKGVSDRTGADELVGANIWISKAQLPQPGVDEYYWSDLKGLTVLGLDDDEKEVNLGQIHELFETGANDVMVVRATADSVDGEERMIPWHKDVVQRVDLEAGRIYVNWGVDY
ncbi:ribosome maturation factor RimM [Acinetobacter sp. KAM398]|uniref:ribosome maturation factor RimM n=1 Tax=unclassified Acinetobacter TaxID=196816 RepID=UPI001EEC8E30|nr:MULTISPECIES: ribosome maturation factor RimM [unclassified Acinetobacter]GJC32579.1 ribosome maturation factor RimM [Acinetobacter sp. KAM392]GJC35399.1 ribosome maturation factor RimM [Acinetobacter sp. KAM393]GJC38217.1 ribosome maturation factor RimM [Acinetobacter sp. KAM394]GJC41020.1 ribosome maturation factor RimM [Acinetobacter sp. KAM395]GJC43858.1 ribosome maturation factor RimM [Acinetobacter sp. KAM396]